MPKTMNLTEAYQYKLEHPTRKVFYEEKTADYSFKEELVLDKKTNEFLFKLEKVHNPKGKMPTFFQNTGFYERHILGGIQCETEEEEYLRIHKEEFDLEEKIKELQKQKDEMTKKRLAAGPAPFAKKPPAQKRFYEVCFYNGDSEKEWFYALTALKVLDQEEVLHILEKEHLGNDGLTMLHLQNFSYMNELTAEEYQSVYSYLP